MKKESTIERQTYGEAADLRAAEVAWLQQLADEYRAGTCRTVHVVALLSNGLFVLHGGGASFGRLSSWRNRLLALFFGEVHVDFTMRVGPEPRR